VRSLPESFTTKAQLLGSESLRARTSVRIRNHRVQVSQTLLAEPYKYSNSRDTSSMAVCCIRWRGDGLPPDGRLSDFRIDEFGLQILQFVNSTIRKWLDEGQRSLAALGISARGSDAAQVPQLARKNSSLYTWGFPENV